MEMLARGPGMDVFTRAGALASSAEDRDRLSRRRLSRGRPALRADAHPSRSHQLHHASDGPPAPKSTPSSQQRSSCSSASIADGHPIPVPTGVRVLHGGAPQPDPGEVQRVMVNGVNLAVEVRGDGPAILFVHGYPLDRTIWADQFVRPRGFAVSPPIFEALGRCVPPTWATAWGSTPPTSRHSSTPWAWTTSSSADFPWGHTSASSSCDAGGIGCARWSW